MTMMLILMMTMAITMAMTKMTLLTMMAMMAMGIIFGIHLQRSKTGQAVTVGVGDDVDFISITCREQC